MTEEEVIRDAETEGWEVSRTADALAFKGCGRTISFKGGSRRIEVRCGDIEWAYFGGPHSPDMIHERLRQTKMLSEIGKQRKGVAK